MLGVILEDNLNLLSRGADSGKCRRYALSQLFLLLGGASRPHLNNDYRHVLFPFSLFLSDSVLIIPS